MDDLNIFTALRVVAEIDNDKEMIIGAVKSCLSHLQAVTWEWVYDETSRHL
jgi:hypothetical protein